MAKKAKKTASDNSLEAELERKLEKLYRKIAAMAIPEASKDDLIRAIKWRGLDTEGDARCRKMFPDDEKLIALYKRAVRILLKILSLSSKGGKRR